MREDLLDPMLVRSDRPDDQALHILGPLGRGARRVDVAVCVVGAAGAEDDIRPDQPGEEHDLGGQEQPHRHLPRRHGGRVGRDGRVAAAGVGWAVLGVAIAIVSSTLRNGISQKGLGPRHLPVRRSSSRRIEEQEEQDRGQIDERSPEQPAGTQVAGVPPEPRGRRDVDQSQQQRAGEVERYANPASRAARPGRWSPAAGRPGSGPGHRRRPDRRSSGPDRLAP